MLIWTLFAAMTGACVFALLWPLGRGHGGAFAQTADAKSLYRAQIGEIDRDMARRLIGTADAEAARAEAGRRLLRSADEPVVAVGETEFSLRRRRAASALCLSCVPLLALLVYGAYGSPAQPDAPLAARLTQAPTGQDFALSLARIESHLAANPDDARGWAVLAPVYLRQGRYDDAARAFASALRHGGTNADWLAGLGEARTLAAGGVVTVEARESFSAAVTADATNARARFFLAIAKEQDGDAPGAIQALRDLLSTASPDASWAAPVSQRLQALEAEQSGKSAIVDLPPAEQTAAIRAMVAGLADRLKDVGGSLDEWTRLIRSQNVLGDKTAARASVATARARLAGEAQAVAQIDALAAALGLTEAAP